MSKSPADDLLRKARVLALRVQYESSRRFVARCRVLCAGPIDSPTHPGTWDPSRYAFVDAVGEINMAIAQSESNASLWRRGLEAAESLTADERMQFVMFIGQTCNLWSVMHQLHEERLLPGRQWLIVCNSLVISSGRDQGATGVVERGVPSAAAFWHTHASCASTRS